MTCKFSKRTSRDYNFWRKIFLRLVCNWTFGLYVRIMYRLEIIGLCNIPKDKSKNYIVAGNHISSKDPFIMVQALQTPVAFMAKEELFEKFFSRMLMDWCGAFAVDREKLGVSTIKTALNIKNTGWKLGLFPQGTRVLNGKIENITKGFASLAKATKADILPVAILGADKNVKIPFTGKIIVKIGTLIPYSDNIDDMVEKWGKAISELTGYEYLPA
ncbi:MAG: lysophospholipid acyltransferase family protein [Candidatus Gastranaerophilales bacterium]|nr:lysophospholipid acyltransferase family protein [Candidatus Gastranaerophilales bacterium]